MAVVNAGADAIGLVFYARSARYVSVDQARRICAVLPPFITTVGLFVNASREEVSGVLDHVPLSLLQFHGDESAADCQGFAVPYIKAIAMQEGLDLLEKCQQYPHAAGFLLDTHQPDTYGGGGIAFDWMQIPETVDKPVILAGGLTPDNVAEAIRQSRPYAVDVSSGVEVAKGIKSATAIQAFTESVEKEDAKRTAG